MPTLVIWYVRAAIVHFVLALIAGLLLVLPTPIPSLRPVYFHLLMVGWVTQLIMGVAYWMFPRHTKENPRGNETLGWATFVLLNLGMLLRLIGEPIVGQAIAGPLLIASAVAQMLAGVLFVVNIWPRVKPRGRL